MRLTVEKSFMKKAGGKMALGNLPLAGVIYDETEAELPEGVHMAYDGLTLEGTCTVHS